jgi:trimeric autotransporter adhesin
VETEGAPANDASLDSPIVEPAFESEPVVEENFVTQDELNVQLLQLSNELIARFGGTSTPALPQNVAADGNSEVPYAAENSINNLSNVTISNATINNSNVSGSGSSGNDLPLSGGTLTGDLVIDGNATTTNLSADTLSVAGTSTLADIVLSSLNCSTYGNGGKLTTDAFGNVICAADQGGSGSTVAGANGQIQFNGFGAFDASSAFTFATSTGILTTPALSSTNASTSLATFATVWLPSLTDALLSTNPSGQIVSTTTIGSNVLSVPANSLLAGNNSGQLVATTSIGTSLLTGTLGIGNGGTGIASTPSYGQLLVGNGSGYTLTATSSLGLPTFANLGAAYPFALTGNATSTLTQFNGGLTAFASSTIGNGTQTGGLTITGGATTTGNALISGALSVGGQTTLGNASTTVLSVSGNSYLGTGQASTFGINSILSCAGSEALQTNGSGNISCGTVSTGGASAGGGWVASGGATNGSITEATSTYLVAVGATSTPYAKFSVLSGSTATTTLALVPASGQTADILDIYNTSGALGSVFTAGGSLGLGTTSPGSILSISGVGNFVANATSTLYNGLNITSGCFSINGACIGTGSGSSNISTSSQNTWSALQIFSNASSTLTTLGTTWFSGLNNAILSTNGSGQVVATTSIGTNYLTGVLGTINGTSFSRGSSVTVTAASSTLLSNNNTWAGLQDFSNATSTLLSAGTIWDTGLSNALLGVNASGQLVSTSSIGANLLTGTLGTINGTTLNVGGSITVTAASSTLLSNNNTFSGSDIFSNGLLSVGSTTIGNGNQNGGLTINGGATTTLNAYFGGNVNVQTNSASALEVENTAGTSSLQVSTLNSSGNLFEVGSSTGSVYLSVTAGGDVGIGTTSPTHTLSVWGAGGNGFFDISSTTSGDIFNVLGSGNVGIGTTTPGSLLSINGVGNFVEGATSTLYQGLNITSSCFSVNGTCISSGGGGSSASSTLLSDNNTFSGIDSFTNASSNFAGTWQGFSPSHFDTFSYLFPSNATSTTLTFNAGLLSLASSTIGNGTQTGGLTITGGATTTGNALISGALSVGGQTTLGNASTTVLSVSGNSYLGTGQASTFGINSILSCAGSEALQTNGSGNISCGTVSTGGASAGGGWVASGGATNGSITEATSTYLVAVGATSTPYAKFSVLSGSTATTTLALVPASGQTADILDIYNTSGALGSVFTAGGSLGLGTTSPGSILSISGVGNFVANATSTLYQGLNITSGCFSVNGTCLPSSGGSSFGYLFPSNATSTTLTFNAGLLSLASTTIGNGNQNGGLTISGGATTTGNAYFAGNVGIGTTTPGSIFSINNVLNFTSATSTFYSTGGINLTSGCFSVNGTCISGSGGGSSFTYLFPGNATSTLLTFNGGLSIGANTSYEQAGSPVLYASSTSGLTLGGIGAGSSLLATTTSNAGNTAFGYDALNNATSSTEDTAIGYSALFHADDYANTGNTAVGWRALLNDTTGSGNNAVGVTALGQLTIGMDNTAEGEDALANLANGSNNTGIGWAALGNGTTGSDNAAIGMGALLSTGGNDNSAIGYGAAQSNTTGDENSVIGYRSLFNDSAATDTTALGSNAGYGTGSYANQGGTYVGDGAGLSLGNNSNNNTLLGFAAGSNITTGSNNIFLGVDSSANPDSQVPGTYNTLTSGSNNISIGTNITLASSTGSNQLNLQNIFFGTGNSATGKNLSSGQLGIGTSTPWARLSIQANNGDTNTALFAIASSTSNSTTTLFSISNTGLTTLSNLLATASSTLQNVTLVNASSTNLILPGTLSCSGSEALTTNSAGLITCGTVMASSGVFPFTTTTFGATTVNATSTLIGFTDGLYALASSTIGNGTQTGGLTIAGGATTTLNAYFASNVGIGTTSPSSLFSVQGNGYLSGNLTATNITALGTLNLSTDNLSYEIAGQPVLYASSTSGLTLGGIGAGSSLLATTTSNAGNTAFGYDALNNATSSTEDTAIGYSALFHADDYANTGNTAVGWRSLLNDTIGDANTAVGQAALESAQDGSEDVAVGGNALGGLVSGSYNTALGWAAMSAADGENNTGVGAGTLNVNLGNNNTAVGGSALQNNGTGNNNVGVGINSLLYDLSATDTVAVGSGAGYGYNGSYYDQDGTYLGDGAGLYLENNSNNNTLLGFAAGSNITTGTNNIFLGADSTARPDDGVAGTNNTLTTGSNNISIGTNITLASSTGSNQLDIGNEIFGIGLSGTGSTASTGDIGVGTSSPSSRLTVWGTDVASSTLALSIVNSASTTVFAVFDGGNAELSGSLSQSSDERLKTNVQSLDASSSLAAINALNPVSFNWVNNIFGSTLQLGFLAQQVQQLFPNLVSTTSPTSLTPDGTLSLNYTGLISPIVSAIQELSADITSIENTIAGFAQSFTTHILTGDDVTANNELCVGSTCITPAQFQAMVAAANASQSSGSSDASAADDSSDGATDTPPQIQINGDNPAVIQVGTTYNDLGATITGPQQDLNLGITTYVNGTEMSPVQIDTSVAATDTIDYVVTDQNGLTSTSTRTVIVEPAESTQANQSGQENTNDTATSSSPTTDSTSTPTTSQQTDITASSTDATSTQQ